MMGVVWIDGVVRDAVGQIRINDFCYFYYYLVLLTGYTNFDN